MSEQPVSVNEAADESEQSQQRQRSGIAFPYNSFGDAEKLVVAIHENVGVSSCSMGQLAVWTKQSAKSSGFRM